MFSELEEKRDGSRPCSNVLKISESSSFALLCHALNLHRVFFLKQYGNSGRFLYWQPQHRRYRGIYSSSFVQEVSCLNMSMVIFNVSALTQHSPKVRSCRVLSIHTAWPGSGCQWRWWGWQWRCCSSWSQVDHRSCDSPLAPVPQPLALAEMGRETEFGTVCQSRLHWGQSQQVMRMHL